MGSYELDVELQDEALARALERQFEADLGRAREITLEEWLARSPGQRLREQIGAAALWLPYRIYSG